MPTCQDSQVVSTPLPFSHQGMGSSSSLVLLAVLLTMISPCFAEILAQVRNSTTLKANTTWDATEGTVLLSTHDKRYGCGFSVVLCPDHLSTCLVFSTFFQEGIPMEHRSIWVANGNIPVLPGSKLHFGVDGNLVLRDATNLTVWSSDTSGSGAVKVQLKSSGNLVLLTANGTEVWRSFDHPTDTLLPGQQLNQGLRLHSSISLQNLSFGAYYLAVEHHRVAMYVNDSPSSASVYAVWSLKNITNNASIHWMTLERSGAISLYKQNRTKIDSFWLRPKLQTLKLLCLRLDSNGSLRLIFESSPRPFSLPLNSKNQGNKFKVPFKGACNLPSRCGSYGICSITPKQVSCSCSLSAYGNGDCHPVLPLTCGNSQQHSFLELGGTDYFSTTFNRGHPVNSIDDCKQLCLQNCSCKAAIFKRTPGNNKTWECFRLDSVLSLINVSSTTPSTVALLKVENFPAAFSAAASRSRRFRMWIAGALGILTVVLLIPIVALYLKKLRDKHEYCDEFLDSIPGLPRRFSFHELRDATSSFSTRLGGGGFGSVYDGLLEDGTKIAVKRLESTKNGGQKQFRAEVVAIASAHHQNLVRLIGFCCDEQNNTLLVYEFMPNGSLDKWIFRGEEDKCLDWNTRFKVALDIARGLAYLHEECEQSILHLDIKPQNILLDVDFKAKISDFGLSMFASKGLSVVATMMRGTPGYMAPEWLQCKVSPKIDVYSFGIVLLEILSGQQAIEFLDAMQSSPLLAVENNTTECLVQLLDSRLHGLSYDSSEIERVIQVALCCIQDDPSTRPAMGDAVKMLEGNLDIPGALLKHQATTLPMSIAKFLAASTFHSVSV